MRVNVNLKQFLTSFLVNSVCVCREAQSLVYLSHTEQTYFSQLAVPGFCKQLKKLHRGSLEENFILTYIHTDECGREGSDKKINFQFTYTFSRRTILLLNNSLTQEDFEIFTYLQPYAYVHGE